MTRSPFGGGAAPRAAAAVIRRPPRRNASVIHRAEPLESRTLLSAFVVDSTADSGRGTLRQALLDANANGGPDEIQFNFQSSGLHTIRPASPLPPLTGAIMIDGTTQPGYIDRPLVELDGSNAGPNADGLVLLSRPSVVRGLAINRFSRHGVVFRELSNATRAQPLNLLEASYIGMTATGDAARPNGGAGVLVAAPFTRVRQHNVISGNAGPGVWAVTEMGTSLAGVTVENNRIGTDTAGERAVGNLREGVLVEGIRDSLSPVEVRLVGNVISGNGASGVRASQIRRYSGATADVTLAANKIGTNAAGTAVLPNGMSTSAAYRDGVTCTDGAAVAIAGVTQSSDPRNLVSGNAGVGVRAMTGATVLVGGAYVGTDATGNERLGNRGGGVLAEGAARVNVAGAVISGNQGDGVRIIGVLSTSSDPSKIYNSRIGISAAGTKSLGNSGSGVYVRGSRNVQIGSLPVPSFDLPYELPPNYIGGNVGHGVTIEGDTTVRDASLVYVRRNRIGIGPDAGGNGTFTAALGNGGSGVFLAGVNRVNVDDNVIGNNGSDGVTVGSAAGASNSNVIEYNSIGTVDSSSEKPDLGNAGHGVFIVDGSNNTVSKNTVAFNNGSGVLIRSGRGNQIYGRSIYSNGGLGIDLAPGGLEGVTPNDPLDADTGPNDLQNAPIINWAMARPRFDSFASYSLSSRPNRTYFLQFYAGGKLLGWGINATTDANGNVSGLAGLPTMGSDLTASISATATDVITHDTSEFSAEVPQERSAIQRAYFFYNNSAYDGHDPGATLADSSAIAPLKAPTYDPYNGVENSRTNYDKGINGIMLDLVLTSAQREQLLTPENFAFVVRDKVWQDGVLVDRMRPAPAPSSISVWRGIAAVGGDRAVITWPDRAIRNAWLEVTFLPPGGGRERPLYFGNLVGDASDAERPNGLGQGSIFRVDVTDVEATRASVGRAADILTTLDFNRDGRINALDIAIVRSNLGAVLAAENVTAP